MRQISLISLSLSLFYFGLLCIGELNFVNGIKLQPEGDKYLWSGESMVVSCRNNNNIKNVKIRWIAPDGLEVSEEKSKRIHTGPAGHRLVLTNATPNADEGQYKCLLNSQGGTGRHEEAQFELKIYKRPSFERTETRKVMLENETGNLLCRVEFDPATTSPTVTWSRNGKPVELQSDPSYKIIDYDLESKESKLQIKSIKRGHAGTYTCNAIAETLHLSRPFEYNIELEVEYPPSFDVNREIVWIERFARNNNNGQSSLSSDNQQDRTITTTSQAGLVPKVLGSSNRRLSQTSTTRPLISQHAKSVQVELRCSCDSNPAASIIWSSGSSHMVLEKGRPSYVLEDPVSSVNGSITTSILRIDYSLDPNWDGRFEEYVCSAKNTHGQDTKRFTIQQGDPAPAFRVAPKVDYNPTTNVISLTILGPKQTSSSPESGSVAGSEIADRPQVDSLRIRVDNGLSPNDADSGYQSSSNSRNTENSNPKSNYHQQYHHQSQSHQSDGSNFRLAHYSALIPLKKSGPESGQENIKFPLNVTVSLASFPSGPRNLVLEAHSAVGWSRHKTELGQFQIVSSGSSSILMPVVSLSLGTVISLSLTLLSVYKNIFCHI